MTDPRRAYIQPRIADPHTGVTMRRWVPRLRTSDPNRGGTVTVMAEGVVMIRRDAFDAVGGWPGNFFLFHEGIDLAWRLWNHGYTGHYAPDILVHHPATQPARHELFYRLNARNRVWLARRNLPAVLVPFNLATWLLMTLWRTRRPSALRVSLAGLIQGMRGGHGTRSPMRWSTVARLTRAGRPPSADSQGNLSDRRGLAGRAPLTQIRIAAQGPQVATMVGATNQTDLFHTLGLGTGR